MRCQCEAECCAEERRGDCVLTYSGVCNGKLSKRDISIPKFGAVENQYDQETSYQPKPSDGGLKVGEKARKLVLPFHAPPTVVLDMWTCQILMMDVKPSTIRTEHQDGFGKTNHLRYLMNARH